MKRTPTYEGPLDAALRYLTPRMRSVGEVEAFLDGLDYGEADVEAAVARLKELGLLDDFAYAREFVRTRLAMEPLCTQVNEIVTAESFDELEEN